MEWTAHPSYSRLVLHSCSVTLVLPVGAAHRIRCCTLVLHTFSGTMQQKVKRAAVFVNRLCAPKPDFDSIVETCVFFCLPMVFPLTVHPSLCR